MEPADAKNALSVGVALVPASVTSALDQAGAPEHPQIHLGISNPKKMQTGNGVPGEPAQFVAGQTTPHAPQ